MNSTYNNQTYQNRVCELSSVDKNNVYMQGSEFKPRQKELIKINFMDTYKSNPGFIINNDKQICQLNPLHIAHA